MGKKYRLVKRYNRYGDDLIGPIFVIEKQLVAVFGYGIYLEVDRTYFSEEKAQKLFESYCKNGAPIFVPKDEVIARGCSDGNA